MGDPEDYDDYDEAEPDDDYDPLDECGLMGDGMCTMAGTEFCDFECPMRDSELFVGSKAWKRKHRKKRKSQPSLLDEDQKP